MPTYPLTFPSTPNIQNFAIRPIRAAGITRSPFDFSQQVFDHQGAQWVGEVKLPPMKQTAAKAWEVFILQCRGVTGTFLMGPPLCSPAGTGTGGDLAVAGAVRDESISVQNAGAAATYKAGDWVQIGTSTGARLHKITADATADGSGNVTLNVEPELKQAYGATTAVNLTNPVGIWRLATNDVGWDINSAARFGFAFSVVESL
jgi:hypothetical protein